MTFELILYKLPISLSLDITSLMQNKTQHSHFAEEGISSPKGYIMSPITAVLQNWKKEKSDTWLFDSNALCFIVTNTRKERVISP